MKLENILQQLDLILESEQLNDIQETVFCLSWQGKTYEQIANKTGYDRDYIKDVGCRLWKQLSGKLKTKVTKRNLHTVFRQYVQKESNNNNFFSQLSETIYNWGNIIDVSFFVGRETEIKTLENWILLDNYPLISIVGMGGIGKSTTAIKLAQKMPGEFQYIFSRSLTHTRGLKELLIAIIDFISQQKKSNYPESIDELIKLTINYLTANRCLLILENIEAILSSESTAGKYRSDCELYQQFFTTIIQHNHKSCIIITSREKIAYLELQEGKSSLVKSLQLQGLSPTAASLILHDRGITEFTQCLIEKYSGNPLALKLIATTIKSVFRGNVSNFLAQETTIYGELWDLLSEQFNRLTQLEQTVMYWLTINREVTNLSDLQADIFPKVAPRKIIATIESLNRRSLIEVTNTGFTQPAIIRDYITELILENAVKEIITGNIDWLKSFCLLKTEAQDCVQEAQTQLIMKPLVERLRATLKQHDIIVSQINRLIEHLQFKSITQIGYAKENYLNLLSYLHVSIK